ncbi:hypothetical protein DT250_24730 [Bacillus sp. AR2-1]|uniref:hypothetical protein n=1 Tax=Bacillus sp. AR2-1 TaxID=2217816 RepID=UPI0011F07AF9|nr:hypothetical protein [Bacillus sp. AR2-1]KAA0760378.1 hypothetical protein DT250_24730 [Bacillus sp. AR2-1]
MYKCIKCGKLINIPSHNATCQECVLASSNERKEEIRWKEEKSMRIRSSYRRNEIILEIKDKIAKTSAWVEEEFSPLSEVEFRPKNYSSTDCYCNSRYLGSIYSEDLARTCQLASQINVPLFGFISLVSKQEKDRYGNDRYFVRVVYGTISKEKVFEFALESDADERKLEGKKRIEYANYLKYKMQVISHQKKVEKYRVTHCWKCNKSLSSHADIICPNCRWISCDCGGCGCNYPGY